MLDGRVHAWTPTGDTDVSWSVGVMIGPQRLAADVDVGGPDVIAAVTADGYVELHTASNGNLLSRWKPTLPDGSSIAAGDIAIDGVGGVYLADPAGRAIRVFVPHSGPVPTAADPSPTPTPSRRACTLRGDKFAAPHRVFLGDTAEVTLTMSADCQGNSRIVGSDIVLLVDRSGSMKNESLDLAREAALAFIQLVDVRIHRIGLASFASDATVNVPLTNDMTSVIDGVRALITGENTDIAAGLEVADQHLIDVGRPEALPVIILLSDGEDHDPDRTGRKDAVYAAAAAARNHGVQIFCLGFNSGEDGSTILRAIAGGPWRYFASPSQSDLWLIYHDLTRLVSTSLTGNLIIDDEMAPDLAYLAGSANPPAVELPDRLRWGRSLLPATGITLTYTIRPQRLGRLPTNRQAVASYTDADGVDRQFIFPIPEIEVIAPSPTPSPTITPTPTPRPGRIFLPLAVRERCTPVERHVDVALVIDASTSMLETTAGGGTKLDAARAAARAFLDQLGLAGGDEAAIVSFNSDARLLQALTTRRSELEAALDRISVAPETRIQRGIQVAYVELAGSRHRAASTAVLVVLTDGRANPDPVSLALEWAVLAKGAGMLVFTVGLGSDLDLAALAEMASRREYFYQAPDGAALAEIYRRIAGTIPCPAEAFWGRRP